MDFKKKGKLVNFSRNQKLKKIPLKDLFEGVNTFPNYFIRKKNGKIIYVIDRTCDHNGGKLINKKNKAICPLHGWELDLKSLKYNDSFECKQKINFIVNELNEIEFFEKTYILVESFKDSDEK
jgi:CMP-N-acetylneuraminate monooxygenase